MNQGFNRRVAVGVAAVGLALMAGPSSADHAWGNYHWARTTTELTLLTGDNVDENWDAYLAEAIADWNMSAVMNLSLVPGAAKGKCRPTAGRIEVCNATYGPNGWLGIAQVWLNNDKHITQATTKLNDTYFNTFTYDTPAWRRMVMCQEIAHDFGLDHQDETFTNANLGSCMDYTNDPDGPKSNEHPNAHDYAMIANIYSHEDATTTAGSPSATKGAPAAMNQIDFDGRGQWGRLVRSSRNGRVQIYELDFGKGNKVITHVFWADPEADARQ